MTTLTLTEARNGLLRVAERVRRDPDTVIEVTKRGRPVLAVLSAGRYAAIEETLEILADEEAMRRLTRSRREAARGRTVRWTVARRRAGL